jgi:hypothetical protein
LKVRPGRSCRRQRDPGDGRRHLTRDLRDVAEVDHLDHVAVPDTILLAHALVLTVEVLVRLGKANRRKPGLQKWI